MTYAQLIGSPDQWPAEEAREEARYFIELIQQNESIQYLQDWIPRSRDHWAKVFTETELQQFVEVFNEIVSPFFSTKM